ncbi:MAG: hypothetical protein ORN83_09250, partial [Chthoniobacteraceae bacterium]|nr:hypothetical protein [Chthoniobacteraceae bacterium]
RIYVNNCTRYTFGSLGRHGPSHSANTVCGDTKFKLSVCRHFSSLRVLEWLLRAWSLDHFVSRLPQAGDGLIPANL